MQAAQADVGTSDEDLQSTQVFLVDEIAVDYVSLRSYQARLETVPTDWSRSVNRSTEKVKEQIEFLMRQRRHISADQEDDFRCA